MAKKPETRCLSQLAISRLASGQRPADTDEQTHLRDCAFCRAQVESETALTHAASQEAVPASIAVLSAARKTASQKPTGHRFAHWQHAMMAIVAVAFVTGVAREMTRPSFQTAAPTAFVERAKGNTQVFGAVKNLEGRVRNLDDLDHLSALQVGETLQIQVQTFDQADVTLADLDDGTVYYQGEVPEGGWLPTGVEVAADGPLRLKLRVCPKHAESPCMDKELH